MRRRRAAPDTNLDEIPGVVRGETVSENALDKQLDNFEVDEDLEGFREVCSRQLQKFRL